MTAFVSETGLANVIAGWNAYASRPLFFQFGTGSGQAVADNDLAAPVQDRVVGSTSQETTNLPGDTLKATGAITAEEDGTIITEVGVFDAATAGNMVIYGDGFPAIDLAAGDAIVFSASVVAIQG